MKKGLYFIIATTLISGFANFFNKFGMQALGKDAFQYTFLKNVLVTLFFTLIIFSPFVFSKLKKMDYFSWMKLILIGLVGGSIPFLLFFQGLSLTSSVSASFIHKTLFIWVAILALPLLKEKVSILQFIALGVLLLGNVIFEGFKGLSWGMAETLIFIATLFWAIETILAKKFLENIEPMVLAWGRMFFGSIFILIFLATRNDLAGLFDINIVQASWLVLVSAFLSGYIFTWYSALKHLPAGVVASILVLASPITTVLNSIFVSHKIMAPSKIVGLALLTLGIFFIIYSNNKITFSKYELNN